MVNKIKQLNGKNLRAAIRNGMTIEDLCMRYGCTVSQVDNRISQIYENNSGKARNAWFSLKANEKNLQGKIGAADETDYQYAEGQENELREVHKVQNVAKSPEQEREERLAKLRRTMEELNQQAKEIDVEIVRADAKLKHCQDNVKMALSRIKGAEDHIQFIEEEMRKKLQVAEEDLRRKIQKHDELAGIEKERMNNLDNAIEKRIEIEEELSRIQDEINELTRISIGIDIDGDEIVIVDGDDVSLDDSGAEEVLSQLVLREDCRNFRVSELSTLSRAIMVVRHLTLPYEIFFVDDRFRHVFEEVLARR